MSLADKIGIRTEFPVCLNSEIDFSESRTMLHSQDQDQVREFDVKISKLHSQLDTASIPEIVSGVGHVMRELLFHDWPEWARNHRWSIPEDAFEDIERHARFLRPFTEDARDFLESPSESGRQSLQKSAGEYLQQRGLMDLSPAIPDGMTRSLRGDLVRLDELTEESRRSGEWAIICGIGDDSFRHRMKYDLPGDTWRIVESGSQRYRVHLDDLEPKKARASKLIRDEMAKKKA